MHYYVITGGPLTSKAAGVIGSGEVIAADKGIDFCLEHGITPVLAVGDMDSVSKDGLDFINNSGIPVKTYPVEKDMTDTEIALTFIPEGNDITIVCPLSGRLDHVIANLQLAAFLHSKGKSIILDDGITEVHFLSGKESVRISLGRWGSGSSVSLIPLSFDNRVEGVVTDGLYYSLNGESIIGGSTLSFSNRPSEEALEFSVSIDNGLLAIVVSQSI